MIASPVTAMFINAFAKGELVLDCGEIELIQSRDEHPKIYTGRGLLLLREAEFQFRFFTDPEPDGHLATPEELRQMPTWQPGELIPKEEYFQLKATDLSGHKWTCSQVQVKRHGGQHGLVLTGRMFSGLVHTVKHDNQAESGLSLYFFDPLPLPLNLHSNTRTELVGELVRSDIEAVEARFRAGGLEFRIQKKPQAPYTVVRAYSEQPLQPGVGLRVEETMRFVTARPARWCIADQFSAGERKITLVPHRVPNKPVLQEPVDPHPNLAGDYWSLFSAYFEYVSKHDGPDEYHPLSIQTFHLTEGEAQQLDLIGLSLSVAIEGVLKIAFPAAGEPTDYFKAAVDQIHKDIEKLTSSEATLVKRVLGSLGGMKSARPGDRLRALESLGVVTQAQSKTWTSLRNTSTHAHVRVDPEAANKLWSDCLVVYTLLLRLIFYAIGYKGRYCDYGSPGWKHLPFQLMPPEIDQPNPAPDMPSAPGPSAA